MTTLSAKIKRFTFKSVQWPVKLFAKPNILPEDPVADLGLDLNQPIYYVLNYYSATDLNLLEQECEKLGLPPPLARDDQSGYLFVLKKRHFWNKDSYYSRHYEKISQILDRQEQDDDVNIQLVPVTVSWGRNPGKERSLIRLFFSGTARTLGFIQKPLVLLFSGRSSLVTFNKPIDLSQALEHDGKRSHRVLKLARLLRIYFHNQRTASLGPSLYERRTLIREIVDQPSVQKAIEREAGKKKISIDKARKQAMSYGWEISGNYSYFMMRLLEKILGWILRKIYDGVEVNHAERLRELARDNELVYVPCHRSHMDYLLVSYVLFHQGLVPPHIAAGINLNFWPVGGILRMGGAFFLRRSFSGNKLYSSVFNEYLNILFNRGYSVEFFPEGGRSRTGRLLPPKTGMVSMTLENVLRGRKKPLQFVPIYIGYDKIMEGNSYIGELRGANKQSESIGQLLGARKKILKQSYGKVNVNFGEPICIATSLDNRQEDWRDYPVDSDERPGWFSNEVKFLADSVMRGINSATAVSPMTLVSLVLLATPRCAIDAKELLQQLDLYLDMLREQPYSDSIVVPEGTGQDVLDSAMQLNAVQLAKQQMGDIIFITDDQAVLMTYYRNNIIHLFVMPALIACCFRYTRSMSRGKLLDYCNMIYPYLRSELFLHWNQSQFAAKLTDFVDYFIGKGFLTEDEDILTRAERQTDELQSLILMSEILQNILKRFSIVLTLLVGSRQTNQQFSRKELESNSQTLAERLAILYEINAPEAFDKNVFATLVALLRDRGAITSTEDGKLIMGEQINVLHKSVLALLPYSVEQQLQQFTKISTH